MRLDPILTVVSDQTANDAGDHDNLNNDWHSLNLRPDSLSGFFILKWIKAFS